MDRNRSHERRVPGGAVRTLGLIAFGTCTAVALGWPESGARRVIEATAQMEQLAQKIDRLKLLHPDTVLQLEEFTRMPRYDCARVVCDSKLRHRNWLARTHLEQSIASKAYPRALTRAGHGQD